MTELGRFANGIIRRKVGQLIGRYGFKEQDREQLEQELTLRLLNSLRSFDPKQSHRNAFVTTIVERNVATIIRDRQAEKRDDRNVSSLNVTCRNGEFGPVELAQLIGQSEVDAQRGRQTRTHEQVVDLGNDIADIVARLPADLRDLAEQLKTKSLVQIARETGVTRASLRKHFDQLREIFEKAGLRLHL